MCARLFIKKTVIIREARLSSITDSIRINGALDAAANR